MIDLSATPGTKRAYRFPVPNNPDVWIPLPDPNSSVCRSPLADDTSHRVYWTNPPGSSPAGQFWNTYARIAAGNTGANRPYSLGTIQPSSTIGPSVSVSGGTTDGSIPLITRSYLWTYVNQYGEESAPSAPSNVVTGAPDGTWVISGMPTSAPANPAGFNYPPITGVNLYRTSTGTATGAQFYRVASFVFASSGSIGAIAIYSGGSGYVVGDTGTIAGGGGDATYQVLQVNSVDPGGSGYAVGDTGLISGGSGDALYTVQSVDVNGAVVTFTFTGGTTYTGAKAVATTTAGVQPGSGTGFHVDTTASGGPISAAVLATAYNTTGAVLEVQLTGTGTGYTNSAASATSDGGAQAGIGSGLQLIVTVHPVSPYTDALPDTVAVNMLTLISAAWGNPPAGLDGLTALPGGMLVGFTDNTVHFCEQDRPHTWPSAYDQSVQYPIVGFGVWQQSLVVLTKGYPSTGSGNSPTNFVFTQVRVPEPCISRGSIITDLMGVYYASQNGLVMLNYFGMQNQTLSTMTKNIWLNRFKATQLIACRHRAQYLALRTDSSGTGFLIDYAEQRMGVMELNTFSSATAVWNDEFSGDAYVCAAGKVYRWDSPSTGPLNFRWRSKQFYGSAPVSIGACQISLDPAVLTPPPSPNTFPMNNGDTSLVLPSGINAVVNIYAGPDGAHLVMSKNLTAVREIFRIPGGFKVFDWQIEIVSRVGIRSIELASTMRELKGV